MTPAERAAAALRDAAEALDELPAELRFVRRPALFDLPTGSLLAGPDYHVKTSTLRDEADRIDAVVAAVTESERRR